MRSTNFVVATTVVIAATLNFGAQGFPQGNVRDGSTIFMVDGFAFDGPARGSRPTTQDSGRNNPTVTPVFPTPSPIVNPTPPPIVNPTPPPIVNPTPAPIVNPTPPPVVDPTPAPVRPEVALCAQNCQVTPEYNPVCGSDGVMYNNPSTLACARNCGINVTQLHLGRCSTPNLRG